MKGESVRVPDKNLQDFCGKTLFMHILDSLLDSELVASVQINTDSNRLKEKLKSYSSKVIVVDRPNNICGNDIPMNDIIKYDLENIQGEHFLQTHATNPLLKPETIDKAIREYFDSLGKGYDSLLSVTPQYGRYYDSHYEPINHDITSLLNTQDIPPIYEENSNLYIFSKTSFSARNHRVGSKPRFFEIGKLESVDIDYKEDFFIAEAIYTYLRKKQ